MEKQATYRIAAIIVIYFTVAKYYTYLQSECFSKILIIEHPCWHRIDNLVQVQVSHFVTQSNRSVSLQVYTWNSKANPYFPSSDDTGIPFATMRIALAPGGLEHYIRTTI